MKLLYRIILIAGFLGIFAFIIAYARGYRVDLDKKTLSSTGIVATTSYPKAAKIYVNGQLKGVTDSSIVLAPGNYDVEIKKEGYTTYGKKITLKGELVATVDAVLFPLNPSLSPLTNLGLVKAIHIDNTDKIIIFVQKEIDSLENPNGIYIFEYTKTNLPFFSSLKTVALKKNLPSDIDFKTASVSFSPDLKEAIFSFGKTTQEKVSFLLALDQENLTPFDITASQTKLMTAWEKQKQANIQKVIETFPKDFVKAASGSIQVLNFSPDETKLLFKATKNQVLPTIITPPIIATNQTQENRSLEKGKTYVYDKKEDKNFEINNPSLIQWYFDSKHLLINEGKKISIIDYDNTNKQAVYSGPFEPDFFLTTGDGNIVILTNLNPEASQYPDLYLVGLR